MTASRRILILGGGFGGIYAALKLKKVIAQREDLEVPDWPGVWALGDGALVPDRRSGGFHSPTAQHALREGRTVVRNVAAAVRGGPRKPLRFSTLGQLAASRRWTGVANGWRINFSGFVAWWLWRTIYLGKLPGLEKKVRIALDWTFDLCFAKDFVCVTADPGASRGGARVVAAHPQQAQAGAGAP
jgi:NADH dehydrogenase FAD-containing subunit